MGRKTIDFRLGWGPWPDEPFADMVGRHCRARKLSHFLCEDSSVRQLVNKVESGATQILFHLDLVAEYEDVTDRYARLAYAVRDWKTVSGTVIAKVADCLRRPIC
jgi:hypothetical protein